MDSKQQPSTDHRPERFESDTDKIVHRHLADKNHVITEDELQGIRVGQTASAAEEPGEERLFDADEKVADKKADSEDEVIPGAEKATPWDVVK